MSLRSDANRIARAGLRAADPSTAVTAALQARRQAWKAAKSIHVVGAGKAGGAMARAAELVLGTHVASSCVIVKEGDRTRTRRIQLKPASHPVPDRRGVAASQEIASICRDAQKDDLIVLLLSGGASALMPLPVPGVSLEAKKQVTRLLLASGADIGEMNAVRKHLSSIKGGQLARLAKPAAVLSLILSDVVGDRLDVIGSGPTAPDRSTFVDALEVLSKYKLQGRVHSSVIRHLTGVTEETPKPGDPLFRRVENVLIGSNQKSLEAAAREAKTLGYEPLLLSSTMEGETRDVARTHAAIARQIRQHGQPYRPPVCLISGGETTVTIRGKGKGGRNQEFVLAAAMDIAGLADIVVLSLGTDGTDGPTDAAGAIADGRTVSRSLIDGKRSLANNDSYPFFAALNDLLITGPTGTNVMDLRLLLIG